MRRAGITIATVSGMAAFTAWAMSAEIQDSPAEPQYVLLTGSAAGESSSPSDAVAATPTIEMASEESPFRLGVQTHFSQGWPLSSLDKAKAINSRLLRDSLPWGTGEPSPGQYDFTSAAAQKLDQACAAGVQLILTEVPRSKLYDGGQAASSSQAQEAFARYLSVLLDRWGRCIAAVEVGNEINGPTNFGYAAGVDGKRAYVDQLRAIKRVIGLRHPGTSILGGSTNMIGTGFLASLFDAGMLEVVDGVAVHPYSVHSDSMGLQINHLRDVMQKYGSPVPIWVTEFSHDTSDGVEAAAQFLKAVTLMSVSGVDTASWYALLDQSFFPNMGLYNGAGLEPVGEAYSFVQSQVLPMGRPTRLDLGDPLLFVYRFGTNTIVAWGADRTVTVPSGATVFDQQGRSVTIGSTVTLTARPLVIKGAATVSPNESPSVLADTLLDYGAGVWQYFAKTSDGKYNLLPYFDDKFDSYYGDRWYRPLRIGQATAAVAGDGSRPIRSVWRYVASSTGPLTVTACFAKNNKGDGVDFALFRNASRVTGGLLVHGEKAIATSMNVRAGDRLDIVVGPNMTYGGDAFSYRYRIVRGAVSGPAAACPTV